MTKTKLGVLKIALTVVLVLTLTASLCLSVAFAEGEAPQTRNFDETYDRMLDGVLGSADATAAYRSVSWQAGQCDDTEDPIFKIAGPKISAGFQVLNIELRSPDASVKLNDLVFGIRIADGVPVQTHVLGSDVMIDGITIAGDEIGTEWATLSIDFAQTEAGIDTSSPDAMVGFHLFAADNTKAGKLDIRKISVKTGTNETVVHNFSDVQDSWWFGTEANTFVDVPVSYDISSSKQIVSDVATSNNLDGAYNAIVLAISGSGNVSVAPVLADGTVGAAKAWADLTDLAGTNVAALDGTVRNAVISLESLGAKEIKGVQISVTDGLAKVSSAFFTNMEEPVLDQNFPVLDSDSITYLSQFNFEYLTAGADYDKAVADCAAFNCDYILSYSAQNSVITNGHVVLDAKGADYTNLKIRSKVASEGRRYLVFKYKLENGAALTNFRFDVIKTEPDAGVGVKWSYEWFVGKGLSSLAENNPYVSANDYKYLVIDLQETFGVTEISGVDLYIGGAGQVLIDEIFYAHPAVEKTTMSENILQSPKELAVQDGAATEHQYLGWQGLDGKYHDGLEIVMRGSEGATLNDVRLELNGNTIWFAQNEQGTWRDNYGRMMPKLSTENQVYYLDYATTGISGLFTDMHIHGNKIPGGATITIESIKYIDKVMSELVCTDEVLAEDFPGKEVVGAEDGGYAYVGWAQGTARMGNDLMILEVEGDISQLRMKFDGQFRWFSENDAGTLVGVHGEKFATSGAQTLVVDLEKSGVPATVANIHFHNNFAHAGDVLKIKSLKFASYKQELETTDEMLAEDFNHEITAADATYAYCGWINGAPADGADYLVMDVEGDISQLRLEMGGGTFWMTANEQGTLVLKSGDISFKGRQTVVIDIAATGMGAISDIHIHNNFAAAGDVLKIFSVKAQKKASPYQSVVIPVNDDAAPVITADIATSGKVGEEIVLSATATDNYSDQASIVISYEVTLGTETITVTDGKFTPEKAGVYAVKITATDKAGNASSKVVEISVEEAVVPVVDDVAPEITSNIATSGKVGEEITLSVTVTDNVDAAADIKVEYQVKLGDETITVTNGKFTPSKEGTYTVTITATDKAGNPATKVVNIVVTAEAEPQPQPQPNQGLSTGEIIAIVIACLFVAAAAVVAVILVRRKKASK